MIFIKRGELEMWEDDRVFCLSEGQSLHLHPRKRHGSVGDMPASLEFYWIHFDIQDDFPCPDTSDTVFEIPQVKRVERPDRLEYLFRYFLDEQETGYLQPAQASWLTMLMLLEVARHTNVRKITRDATSLLATRAHSFIRLNFDQAITAGDVAEALGYNADYLGRVYRKAYGYTLTEAIHRRRIKAACRYLLDTDMLIEEIAKTCGYADTNYFRRVFQHHMHNTPRAYRKQYAHMHVNTQ
ncbi:MAG: helix-turn-helix domain-containing protein [Anaerolineae bacterium]|nr:helix-turn-helix domain-containing protein [Anaerolineae bacterium]